HAMTKSIIFKFTTFICFVLIQTGFVFGQSTSVRGIITDLVTGETLPYVTITVPGSTIGTSADDDGRYTIKLSGGQTKLKFNFIGYLPVEVDLKPGIDQTIKIGRASCRESIII